MGTFIREHCLCITKALPVSSCFFCLIVISICSTLVIGGGPFSDLLPMTLIGCNSLSNLARSRVSGISGPPLPQACTEDIQSCGAHSVSTCMSSVGVNLIIGSFLFSLLSLKNCTPSPFGAFLFEVYSKLSRPELCSESGFCSELYSTPECSAIT